MVFIVLLWQLIFINKIYVVDLCCVCPCPIVTWFFFFCTFVITPRRNTNTHSLPLVSPWQPLLYIYFILFVALIFLLHYPHVAKYILLLLFYVSFTTFFYIFSYFFYFIYATMYELCIFWYSFTFLWRFFYSLLITFLFSFPIFFLIRQNVLGYFVVVAFFHSIRYFN